MCGRCLTILTTALALAGHLHADGTRPEPTNRGAPVTYQLPTDGPLPRTYRVTLCITDPKNPDWIVSQFVSGAVRKVTAENQGKFTEYWNGLDDSFMPVPPGRYGVKGIYMPAERWHINGEYHTLIPKLAVAAGDPWFPDRQHEDKLPYLYGASIGYIAAIAVAPNGKAAFLHSYLENSLNDFLIDLNRPIGYDQVIRAHPSWGSAGGWATATDGEVIWSACTNGGIPFVYRADRKPFGNGRSGYLNNVWLPSGDITALAAWRDPSSGKRFLYVAEDETFSVLPWPDWRKGPQKIKKEGGGNRIVVLDGDSARELAQVPIQRPAGLVVRDGKKLYALHQNKTGQFVVSELPLQNGLPAGQWRQRFLTPNLKAPPQGTWPDRTRVWTPLPPGFAVDSRENVYVSDPMHNQLYRLDNQGRIVHRFGRAARQKPGHYDEQVFMTPTQLAVWRDAGGQDRLLILERGGPGRISEWTPEGRLLRQWFAGPWSGDQGYAVDPEDPEHVYAVCNEAIPAFGLVRFRVNYDTGDWKVDAVWPDICSCLNTVNGGTFPGGCDHWKVINYKGRKYLAFARSIFNTYGVIVYRQDGDNWVPSAALIPTPRKDMPDQPLLWGAGFAEGYWWHDANGDGKLQEEEYRNNPTKLPGPTRYWGENWLNDLSLTWIQSGSPHIWRIAPSGFDQHGNPIFDGRGWQKLLTDPIYVARAEKKADALHGGNELAEKFEHHWEFVDGSPTEGFYVVARGGKDFDANSAPQYKISRYVPDGKGGYRLKWRTGRAVYGRQLGAVAEPGEIYGALIITRPVNGLLGVQDSLGGLYHIYTDDGLYVDTLFSDFNRYPLPKGGVYFLGGENFSGYHFLNKKNGKVYVCMTANNPCCLFEVRGWTREQNPVRRLTSLPAAVTLEAHQIASPAEHTLRIRGGAGKAWLARFYPVLGGPPAQDGSLQGWEACAPVFFQASDKRTVEVRCFYDPEHLYLRWHARLGRKFEPKPLHPGAERIFTHDRGADTLSFYLQGDPQAKPGTDRPGDVRLVFGIFQDGGKLRPAVLGMYPKWSGPAKANPVVYGSGVAPAAFEHVALLEDVKLTHHIDADEQGFVLTAVIPRKVFPRLPELGGGLRTFVNFEATFGGRNKFWWANSDGSASILTLDEPSEARLYPGSWASAQWVDVHRQAIRTWNVIGPFGFEKLPKLRHEEDRPVISETLLRAKFPPETKVDFKARYQGPMTQTRQKQRTLTWQFYSTGASDVLDFQQALDWKQYPDEGAAYAVAYIHSPAEAEIQLRLLHTGGGHALRVWLNDKLLPPVVQAVPFSPQWFPVPPAREKLISGGRNVQATSPQTVRLREGWNQLLLRFDWVYEPQQAGVLLDGDEKTLWHLRLRAQRDDGAQK